MTRTGARITEPAAALAYMLAGRSKVTLVSRKTGSRFTYKVAAPREVRPGGVSHFVSLLTQQDNEGGFQYLGTIRADEYHHGKKARVHPGAPSAMAFKWAWSHLKAGELPECVEVWHEGACGRCGRALTVPSSIASGLGPECAKKERGR